MAVQHVHGVPLYNQDPNIHYKGLDQEPTWFSAQGGVYRCQKRTHPFTQVAIKKYLVENTPKYPDLFVMPKELVENEIYTMTSCIHPNILKLHSVHLHEEFVYLVMPYCTGGSLQQYVYEHHLTAGQLVNIIQSIASGLAEIHHHGYIHRDIKCDNIFLDKETNNIVIGDFGVVSVTPAADSNLEEAGVVLFWSPELVQRKIVSRKVDIWALGIVILEILNGGRAPYEDEKLEEEELKARILQKGRPDYPAGLPPLLVDLLDRCLQVDSSQRASANDVLKHPFLSDYTPEPLFPGIRVDGSHDAESDSEEQAQDQTVPHKDSPTGNTLEKLRTMEVHQEVPLYGKDSVMSPVLSPPPSHDVSNASSTSMLDASRNNSAANASNRERQKQRSTFASNARRCRIPQRAFVLEVKENTSTQEKIASVLRKRQSMSDTYRSQGSRLPMLVMSELFTQSLDEIPEKKPRHAKSARLERSSAQATLPSTATHRQRAPAKMHTLSNMSKRLSTAKKEHPPEAPTVSRKPLARQPTNSTTTSRIASATTGTLATPAAVSNAQVVLRTRGVTSQPRQRKEGLAVRPKVLLNVAGEHQEAPQKRKSVFRRKCPPGESRTARLTMGISTTGRRPRSQMTEEAADSPSTSSLTKPPSRLTDEARRKRPLSFATERHPMSANEKRQNQPLHPEYTRTTPLPRSDPSRHRPLPVSTAPSVPASKQARPALAKRRTAAVTPKKDSVKDIKPVRVH